MLNIDATCFMTNAAKQIEARVSEHKNEHSLLPHMVSTLFSNILRCYHTPTFQVAPFSSNFPASLLHDSGTITGCGNKQHHQQQRQMRRHVEMTPTHAVIDKRDKRTRRSLTN